MAALTVEVRGRDIVVTEPGTGLSVTYRREPDVPGCAPPVAERPRSKNVEVSGRRLGSRLWQSERSRLALVPSTIFLLKGRAFESQ